MRVKVSPRLKLLVSKHFIQRLPKVSIPVSITQQSFLQYWERCPLATKRSSLVFFSKDLIEFVNKTNNRLLYCDLLHKKQQASQGAAAGSQDYQLLNAFEMLWNIENTQAHIQSQDKSQAKAGSPSDKKSAQNEDTCENLDLVQILSHTSEHTVSTNSDDASLNFGSSKVQGHALTIKDEFIN